jgi:uncharacterized protein (DUF2236 family)
MTATAPLDPEGLVWEHFGRLPVHRLSNGLREALLQNMHPGLAAGVEHHSVFFEIHAPAVNGRSGRSCRSSTSDPRRTSGESWCGVSTARSKASTNTVADTALDPETFFWAHLKAVHAAIRGIPTHFQYFPIARDQRAQYRRTGTVAPLPLPTHNPHQ